MVKVSEDLIRNFENRLLGALKFVYLREDFTETITVPVEFENFIREAGGPISYQEVKDFCVGKVFMKVPGFHEVIQRNSKLLEKRIGNLFISII
jgi:hypothetical protein